MKEHLEPDSESHIFNYLNTNRNFKKLCDNECFEIIDFPFSSYRLKLKEAITITWEKHSLSKQVKHKYFYNYVVTYCVTFSSVLLLLLLLQSCSTYYFYDYFINLLM